MSNQFHFKQLSLVLFDPVNSATTPGQSIHNESNVIQQSWVKDYWEANKNKSDIWLEHIEWTVVMKWTLLLKEADFPAQLAGAVE